MKNKFIYLTVSVLMMITLLIPGSATAAVQATNFAETINEELTAFKDTEGAEQFLTTLSNTDLSNYKESDDKINVYIFRGNTCGYCLKAVTYFASIVGEYGKYFNLVTYEVWSNADNSSLLEQVAAVFGETVSGVPYIVIGDKTFTGYADTMNTEIQNQIVETYNSKDKYDVMDHLGETKENTSTASSTNNVGLALIALEIVLGFIVIAYLIIKSKKEIIETLQIKNNKKEIKEEIVKDVVKPVEKEKAPVKKTIKKTSKTEAKTVNKTAKTSKKTK